MFKKIKATHISKAHRKLLYNVGVNDSNYNVVYVKNNIRYLCPEYTIWKSILQRCFAKEWHNKYPTYKNCTIDEDWKIFSKFQIWLHTQNWKSKDLDKDILISGNKHYSPNSCIFIPPEINRLLSNSKGRKGKLPIGVSKNKKLFMVRLSKFNKSTFVGLFKTIPEATEAFLLAKSNHVKEVANTIDNLKLKKALYRISIEIRNNTYYI